MIGVIFIKSKLHFKRMILVVVSLLIIISFFVISLGTIMYPTVLTSGSGEKIVLCIGDSITYGQGVLFNREEHTYPALLSEKLGVEYQVKNYGLCNRTMLMKSQMPYVNEKFYNKSLNEDADIVLIMLGTNDTKSVNWNKERFERDSKEFILSYINMESSPKVYVMLPPKIHVSNALGNCDNEILINEIIPILIDISKSLGVEVIDIYEVTDNHKEYFLDGLHPNYDGNIAISNKVYEAIKE